MTEVRAAGVLLTVEQAAERLGTSRGCPAADRGTQDRVSQVGHHVRISERALAEFIEACRCAGPMHPQEGGLMAGKRWFGRVRGSPSGTASSLQGPDGIDRPAPLTFISKTSAERWLTLTEAEIIQATGSPPAQIGCCW